MKQRLAYFSQQGKASIRQSLADHFPTLIIDGIGFDKCDFLVACLGEPGCQSRFVGVFQVLGIERETEEHYHYNLVEVSGFADLKERVIFDWGKAAINWHQWLRPEAGKTVLEIQPKPFSQLFTDYLDLTLSFAELTQLITSQSPRDEWGRILSATAGVYLILGQSSGKQYSGSASGTEGGGGGKTMWLRRATGATWNQ